MLKLNMVKLHSGYHQKIIVQYGVTLYSLVFLKNYSCKKVLQIHSLSSEYSFKSRESDLE